MDELDPYREMPASSKDEPLLLPALDAMEYTTERSIMNGGLREQHADAPPARRDNGVRQWEQGGHAMAGRQEGGPLSAQASCLAICALIADSFASLVWNLNNDVRRASEFRQFCNTVSCIRTTTLVPPGPPGR